MNSIKFLSKITLAASFLLALVFAFSCSSSGNNDGNGGGQGGSFNENSQIYIDGNTLYRDNGIIKVPSGMTCGDGDCHWELIGEAGSVTNGIVKLELPPTISGEYLRDFISDDKDSPRQSSCTDYPEDIKALNNLFYFQPLILTSSNGEYIGNLIMGYIFGENTFEFITYVYFSKDGKITCNFEGEAIYNLNVKEGWNKIYWRRYLRSNTQINEWSTNNILTKEKEMKWIILQE